VEKICGKGEFSATELYTARCTYREASESEFGEDVPRTTSAGVLRLSSERQVNARRDNNGSGSTAGGSVGVSRFTVVPLCHGPQTDAFPQQLKPRLTRSGDSTAD